MVKTAHNLRRMSPGSTQFGHKAVEAAHCSFAERRHILIGDVVKVTSAWEDPRLKIEEDARSIALMLNQWKQNKTLTLKPQCRSNDKKQEYPVRSSMNDGFSG